MASELIPIELDLTEGRFYTIWAPSWRDGEDEWEAFLGKNDRIFVFPSPGHLYAFCVGSDDHELIEHPQWLDFRTQSPLAYLPTPAARYPLIDVMDIAAQNCTTDVLHQLATLFSLCKSIGSTSNLYAVEKFFLSYPMLTELASYADEFTGPDGFDAWVSILQTIYNSYDDVLDAIDAAVHVVDVDEAEAATANELIRVATENLPARAENTPEDTPGNNADQQSATITSSASFYKISDPELEQKFAESLWTDIGIDPIMIITETGTYYTLRCYLGEKVIFLGNIAPNSRKIFAFSSPEELIEFLAALRKPEAQNTPNTVPDKPNKPNKHSMVSISTFNKLVDSAANGTLDVIITPENTYTIKGLHFQIGQGPTKVNPYQLELAIELFSDLGNYQKNEHIQSEILAPTAPIGWFSDYVIHHKTTKKLAPPAPYDHEVALWEELEQILEASFITPQQILN